MDVNHRLNVGDRQEITRKFAEHTFEVDTKNLMEREMDLSVRARCHLLGQNVSIGGKIYKEYDLIEMLPKKYSQDQDQIYVNASGYSLHLYFGGYSVTHALGLYIKFDDRLRLRMPAGNRHDITDAKLNTEMQQFANDLEKLKEAHGKLCRKMMAFLATVRTVKKLLTVMPEIEEILGEEWFVKTPSNALVVTAAEILCEVANIRGEKREGCCNGEVIAL